MTWNENLLAWLESAKEKYGEDNDAVLQDLVAISTYKKLESGTNGTAGASAEYVTFGAWPQTIKAANVKIREHIKKEVGLFTYYAGSDGAWYCKALEKKYSMDESEYKYSNGEVVKVENPSYRYFKVEPIKWRVFLKKFNSGSADLLVAESVLMANVEYRGYTESQDNTYFSKSGLRSWLNGLSYNGDYNKVESEKGFLQTAFDIELRSKISSTIVPDDAQGHATSSSQNAIFILSNQEVIDYVGSNNGERIRKPTDFALANFVKTEDEAAAYFLRTMHDYVIYPENMGKGDCLKVVHADGSLSTDGITETNTGVSMTSYSTGIVPALCVDSTDSLD